MLHSLAVRGLRTSTMSAAHSPRVCGTARSTVRGLPQSARPAVQECTKMNGPRSADVHNHHGPPSKDARSLPVPLVFVNPFELRPSSGTTFLSSDVWRCVCVCVCVLGCACVRVSVLVALSVGQTVAQLVGHSGGRPVVWPVGRMAGIQSICCWGRGPGSDQGSQPSQPYHQPTVNP